MPGFAHYDGWKTTEPVEQRPSDNAGVPLNERFNENKLAARLTIAGFKEHRDEIIKVVDEWLLEYERVWRTSNDERALRWANTLNTIRTTGMYNKGVC